MFGTIFELLAGQHRELPRRRVADPTFDAKTGGFLAPEETPIGDGTWLDRGQVPGVSAAPNDERGQTVAEEVRQLVERPRS